MQWLVWDRPVAIRGRIGERPSMGVQHFASLSLLSCIPATLASVALGVQRPQALPMCVYVDFLVIQEHVAKAEYFDSVERLLVS